MQSRVRLTKKALAAYSDWSKEVRSLSIPIGHGIKGFVWEMELPDDAFEPGAFLRAWLRRNGRTRQIGVWTTQPDPLFTDLLRIPIDERPRVILGEYPQFGDTVILRW